MKSIKVLLSVLLVSVAMFSFTSCGDDDKEDLNLYDKSEIIGTHSGKVTIKALSLANTPIETISDKINFQKLIGDDKKLNMSSEWLGGPIAASNFMMTSTKDKYTFNLAGIPSISFTGNEIKDFIREWYSIYEINKVEFSNLVPTGKANYVKSTKAMDFVYTGKLKVYLAGQTAAVAESNVTLTFEDFKK